MKFRPQLIAAILAMLPLASLAGLDEGLAAYYRGDYQTALREFTPLAEQGNRVAQYNLAQMYRRSEGVAQNDQEAVRLYRLAGAQGDADAQNNLGVMYGKGQGVAQDMKESYAWFATAAANGNANAAENRDLIGRNLTPAQLEEAQALARQYAQRYLAKP